MAFVSNCKFNCFYKHKTQVYIPNKVAMQIFMLFETTKCDPGLKGKQLYRWCAIIAQWICLRLASYHPGVEFQAHHLCFYKV